MILVVDDERSIRESTRRLLSRIGYEVLVAESPKEALRIFASQPRSIDLVLTDVVMPSMSGRALGEQIRQLRADLPILYMSGDPTGVISREEILPPGIYLLAKPFDAETLSSAVQEALSWWTP